MAMDTRWRWIIEDEAALSDSGFIISFFCAIFMTFNSRNNETKSLSGENPPQIFQRVIER